MAQYYHYSESCPCGSTLKIEASDSLYISRNVGDRIIAWQNKHSRCVPLAIENQRSKIALLEQRHQNLLYKGS